MARSGTVLRNMMVVGLMHSQSELSPASLPLSGRRRTDTIILSSLASAAISSPGAPMAMAAEPPPPPPPPAHPRQPRAVSVSKPPPSLHVNFSGNPVLHSRTKHPLALRDSDAPPRLAAGENGKFRTRAVGAPCPRRGTKAAGHRALDGSGR